MGQPLAAVTLCAGLQRRVPYAERWASHARCPSAPPTKPVFHPSSVFRVSGPCGGEGWQGWVHARHRDPSGLSTHHVVAIHLPRKREASRGLFFFVFLMYYLYRL